MRRRVIAEEWPQLRFQLREATDVFPKLGHLLSLASKANLLAHQPKHSVAWKGGVST
jgi:hypothetical protein